MTATPHLTLGAGGRVHYANVNTDGCATNRPVCGAGSRRSKGTRTLAPVTCTKCEAIAANNLIRPTN